MIFDNDAINDPEISEVVDTVCDKLRKNDPRLGKVHNTLIDHFLDIDEMEDTDDMDAVYELSKHFVHAVIVNLSYQVKSIQKQLLKLKNRIKFTKPSPFKPKKRCLKKNRR